MRILSCRTLLVLAVAIYASSEAEYSYDGNAIENLADPPAPPAEAGQGFLKARREDVTPEDVDPPPGGRRPGPGVMLKAELGGEARQAQDKAVVSMGKVPDTSKSPLVVSDIQKHAAVVSAKDRKIAELTKQLQSIKRSAIKRTSLGDAAAWFNAGAGENHQGEACTNIPRAGKTCELNSNQLVTKCKNSPSWTSQKNCQQSCWDAGQGYEGDDCSSPTGEKLCVNVPNCNPAKCHGSTQDNSLMYGNLECETDPVSGVSANTGALCLDNLSSGKFWVSRIDGQGRCHSFGDDAAFRRKTFEDRTANSPRYGLISKLLTGHPNYASRNVGVISGKRITCTGDVCHVFKTGYCIKCPGDVFRESQEQQATKEDINKFYQCCVMGGDTYKKDDDSTANCHSAFRDGGAFTAYNNASAVLKPDYICTGEDREKAEAMMKAS